LLRHYFVAYYSDQIRRSGGNSQDPQVQFLIEQEIRTTMGSEAGVRYLAWDAFSDGRFAEAIDYYRKQLKPKKKNPSVREDLGTALFLIQDYQNAAAELQLAIEERSTEEAKELVVLYRPKALLQHKRGLALARQGDLLAAREAFGKALEEDLSFYPAHLILANMALAAGDTATAFQEYGTAAELHPDDPAPHLAQAQALIAAKRFDQAIESLRKLGRLEPYFAQPHFDLANILAAKGDSADAVLEYRRFLATSTRDDRNRPTALQRLGALGGAPNTRP
jgi:tetratricopeptide (TPR) repeat protein